MRLPNPRSNDTEDSLAEMYDHVFFQDHLNHQSVYQTLSQIITDFLIQPANTIALDMGCGHGLLVEGLRQCGVLKSYGIEGSSAAQAFWPTLHLEDYTLANLCDQKIFNIIPVADLVTTFETAEHLEECYADHFIQAVLWSQPKLVLFGAATWLQDQGQNPSHYNEQPHVYWINRFKKHGYNLDIFSTIALRNRLFKSPEFSQAWWYPKNILVFYPNGIRMDQMIYKPADVSILNQGLNWFNINQSNTMFANMLIRDYLDYKLLVQSEINRLGVGINLP